MPVEASDLVRYGAANHPVDDVSAVGGGIDLTKRPLDSQFAATARPEIVSGAAGDTMNVTIVGRIADGTIVTEAQALNGTTPVLFTAEYQRIHTITLASATTGAVTVRQGASGPTRHTFAAGELVAFTWFQRSSSGPSAETRFEKAFWRNNHGSLALTEAKVTLLTDAASLYRVGLETAKDGSLSAGNRKTAPAGVTYFDDGVEINIPTGSLGPGEAIGYFVEQQLGADAPAAQTTLVTQISGATVQ